MASENRIEEDRLDLGLCACRYVGGSRSGCPYCVNKRIREETMFDFLREKNPDLENKGTFLLMRAMEVRIWKSLTTEEKIELEKEATEHEDKTPVTVFEEQFSALHDMDFEWAQLELSEKIEWMKKAEACLYDDEVVLVEGRRILVEGAARNG